MPQLYISNKPNLTVRVAFKRTNEEVVDVDGKAEMRNITRPVTEKVQFINGVLYLDEKKDPALKAAFDKALLNPQVSRFARKIAKDHEQEELRLMASRGQAPRVAHTGTLTSDVVAENMETTREEAITAAVEAGVDPGATVPGMTMEQTEALGVSPPEGIKSEAEVKAENKEKSGIKLGKK